MEEKKVTNGVTQPMINKFLLAISFLFIFSGSANCEEQKVKREYWRNGKLKSEVYYKDGKIEGLETWFYRTGEKLEVTHCN